MGLAGKKPALENKNKNGFSVLIISLLGWDDTDHGHSR